MNRPSSPRALTRFVFSCWCVFGCALFFVAHELQAAEVSDLYEAEAPIRTSQDAAFAEALRTVLVRVSGRRDAPQRLGGALNNPRQYAQRFGVTADNRLQVGFDDVSIDRLLVDAGLPVWGRERPAVLVLLNLEQGSGSSGWVGADVASAEREAVQRAARERGLPLKWGTDPSGIVEDPTSLLQLATRYDANAVLLGRGTPGAVRWTLVSNEGEQSVSGMLEDGVHMAADVFARVFAASGSTLETIAVQVSGIRDLNAYASTLNYLEGMTLVRNVAVEQMAGDTVHLRLAVRGDAQTLQRAIGLERRLVPDMEASGFGPQGAARLAFRYQP